MVSKSAIIRTLISQVVVVLLFCYSGMVETHDDEKQLAAMGLQLMRLRALSNNNAGCEYDVYEKDECQASNNDAVKLQIVHGKESIPSSGGPFNNLQNLPRRPVLRNRFRRNALICPKWLWPAGNVPFDASSLSSDINLLSKFNKAVNEINRLDMCVQFSDMASTITTAIDMHQLLTPMMRKYLTVELVDNDKVTGNAICAATAGRSVPHPTVRLSPKCTTGQILHELLHVLGLAHEHSRPDRDQYVLVKCENIQSDSTGNFRRLKSSIVTSFDLPYDYQSIMHYRIDHFSRDGKSPTLIPLDPTVVNWSQIGLMKNLSNFDVLKVRKMYCKNFK